MKNKFFIFFLTLHLLFTNKTIVTQDPPFYIVTAADEDFFPSLLNFIGGIHKSNFDHLAEIAIFDLGLTVEQKKTLKKIAKTNIYSVEMTHPDLLKHFNTRPWGKPARGWYAWKPVVIKQALDMFPDILYLDAGILVLQPLDNLFRHIRKQGYFFTDCDHSIEWMTTKYVIKEFDLHSQDKQWILDPNTYGINGGFQGLTHKLYNNYVLPMYEHSKNLTLFIDDGTTPKGFGTGRHDQTLFSIYVRLLHLEIFKLRSPNWLTADGKAIPDDYIGQDGFTNPITHGRDFLWRLRNHPNLTSYIKYCN